MAVAMVVSPSKIGPEPLEVGPARRVKALKEKEIFAVANIIGRG
jgi:hypothetical protein